MMDVMQSLTLIGLILIFVYPFAIYPMVVAWLARRSRWKTSELRTTELPTVALVICALNEERIIRQKVENSLALNYPAGLLRIVVISDGSTDQTAEIGREFRPAGVEVVDQPVRRGKITNLNEIVPARDEDIIVLSDANVLYHTDAVMRIVERFRDPSVGCVSGKVVLQDTTPDLDAPTEQYYSLEWALQENSSAVYSMTGADGAMYGIRRELFRPCLKDTIIEDFVIPMQVIRKGKRVVFEPAAIGWEKGVESLREEFRRKVRIAAGAAQGLVRGNAWPVGAPARFWFIFVSHKLLRWLSPVSGLLVLIVAGTSFQAPLSQVALAGTAMLAILALLRLITGWTQTVFSAPFYFLFGQAAMAVGLLKGFAGQQTVLWAKANR
jgi:cellulose synthase/poly-beta-1,6-N-acetylglucosamine synthase-like glycosyltransferase